MTSKHTPLHSTGHGSTADDSVVERSTGRGSDRRTVHVVGGGLAGLTAAAVVARAGLPVVVHEQRNRLGGRATTDEHNGFRFNQGPHALYLGGEGAQILRGLGVRIEGSPPPHKGARLIVDGAAHVLPGSTGTLAVTRALGTRDKVDLGKMLARVGSVDTAALAGLTVEEWISSTTDRPRPARVLHALIRLSAYVNDPGRLSAQVGVLQLQRGVADGVTYLDGGWEGVVGQLADLVTKLGGRVVAGEPVTELPDVAAVVVAAGGPAVAARLTGAEFTVGPASEASVLDLSLSAPAECRFALGTDDAMYLSDHGFMKGMSPEGHASISIAQYLAAEGQPGAEPDRAGLRAFGRHAGITDDMVLEERYLHRMTTVSAIATADLGGLAGRPAVGLSEQPGVFLAGDWVGNRGHLADAVVASAEEAALRAVAHVERSLAA
ncbi:MAG: NAD(P)-binding protein [Ilumatobacteraceae bacterium]